MPHKLRVVEGGEEKSALAAKGRLFLRIIKRKTFRYRYTGAGAVQVPTIRHGQVRFLVMYRQNLSRTLTVRFVDPDPH
jgi:hypothetical protein